MSHLHRYSVTLRPEPEGGFTVRVPAFPEIVTYGADETEALANAKEAIELSIEHYLAEGSTFRNQNRPVSNTSACWCRQRHDMRRSNDF